jgi:murein DD-endopeptidase MepM/ murein hydrolase activator NlpD
MFFRFLTNTGHTTAPRRKMKNINYPIKNGQQSASKPPQSKPSKLFESGGLQFIYVPNTSGVAKRFTVSKFSVSFIFLISFMLVGSFGGMIWYTKNTQFLSEENKRLKEENHSIRAEASVIIAKLQEVQNNLSKVDQMSDQVRAEASQLEPAPPGAKKIKMSEKKKIINKIQDKQSLDMQSGTLLKVDALEFKDLFVALNNVTDKSHIQAQALETLSEELQAYRSKISLTPTIAPVKGTVTSNYGVRVSPFTGSSRMHQGVDIAAPLGSSILSAANGTVTKVSRSEDYGIYVEITHGYGVLSRYAHASKIIAKVGDKVKKGQQIGLVGMTGRTTGPHLHYEVEINGRKTNPGEFIR